MGFEPVFNSQWINRVLIKWTGVLYSVKVSVRHVPWSSRYISNKLFIYTIIASKHHVSLYRYRISSCRHQFFICFFYFFLVFKFLFFLFFHCCYFSFSLLPFWDEMAFFHIFSIHFFRFFSLTRS